jgi:hypothetical protein
MEDEFWNAISDVVELCYDILDKTARVGVILEKVRATREEITHFVVAVLVGTYLRDPDIFEEIVTISKTLAMNIMKQKSR